MRYISIPSIIALMIIAGFSFSSCGESVKEKAERETKDSIHRFDSLIKPRKDIYDVAVSSVKELLKAPKTAQFPALTLQNDTVKMKYTDSKAWVMFPYDAQNPMGTYMHDIASVKLVKNNGKWVLPGDYYDVNASAFSGDYKAFDQFADMKLGQITNGNTPTPATAPTSTPVPAPAPMPH